MAKEQSAINHNAFIIFNETIYASELNKLIKEFRGSIVVNKKLIIDENLDIENTIFVMGSITHKGFVCDCNIKVKGSIYCYGHVNCHSINVGANLYCKDGVYSKSIKVGEHFWSDNTINAYGGEVVVAGDLECEREVEAGFINVLGSMHVYGRVEANKIIVGCC